jgi:phosphatidylserine/phosphatidylglycerophosphate/cardiolipin synthase-like enzyme
MIPSSLAGEIDVLIRKAHGHWLQAVCAVFGTVPESIDAASVIASLPPTNNGDAAHSLASIIRQSSGILTWKALGSSIEVCSFMFDRWREEQHIELLWTGPSPASQIPARRIDQVLYDLIRAAKREILLVTFAAHKISRLTDGLVAAIERGVAVSLILEFEEASAGQLSMDAMKAFPAELCQRAKIYYWPLDKRQRNSFGNPGKLHAKVAVIDDQAMLSSANLTDDAFSRNLELGTLISSGEIIQGLRGHFDCLCVEGTLRLWKPKP